MLRTVAHAFGVVLDSDWMRIVVALGIAIMALVPALEAEGHSGAWYARAPMIPSDPVVFDSAPTMGGNGISHAVTTWDTATSGTLDPVIGSWGNHEVLVEEGFYEDFGWGFTVGYQNGYECGSCSYTDYAIIYLDTDDYPLNAI